jgi:predicted metal-dependent hydrolase
MHPRLLEGIEHFNAGRFWEAHESWEQLWMRATGEEREFLQGLIQLAAAYHHSKRGTLSGAVRLFDTALARMEPFPPGHDEIDRSEAVRAAAVHRDWAEALVKGKETGRLNTEEWPRLKVCAPLLQGFDKSRAAR